MNLNEFYWPDSDMPADELYATGEVTVHIQGRITEALRQATVENHGHGVWSAVSLVDGTSVGATGTSYYDAAFQLVLALIKHFGMPL